MSRTKADIEPEILDMLKRKLKANVLHHGQADDLWTGLKYRKWLFIIIRKRYFATLPVSTRLSSDNAMTLEGERRDIGSLGNWK